MTTPKPPTPTPALALVVIARDEAASIAACLQSAAAVVDRMIVLDTGSRDATVAIAEGCGAQVHHFAWCDDFAAARNAALAHSNARWHLILDADERLVSGQDQLRALSAQPAEWIGVLPVASAFDLAGPGGSSRVETSTAWLPRLLPGSVRYQGAVHEQPVSDLPRRRLAIGIAHTGYRRAALERKRGRNRRLLQAMLEVRPDPASKPPDNLMSMLKTQARLGSASGRDRAERGCSCNESTIESCACKTSRSRTPAVQQNATPCLPVI